MNRVIKRIALDAASSKIAPDSEQLEVKKYNERNHR